MSLSFRSNAYKVVLWHFVHVLRSTGSVFVMCEANVSLLRRGNGRSDACKLVDSVNIAILDFLVLQ
jgi:hypothetical protein